MTNILLLIYHMVYPFLIDIIDISKMGIKKKSYLYLCWYFFAAFFVNYFQWIQSINIYVTIFVQKNKFWVLSIKIYMVDQTLVDQIWSTIWSIKFIWSTVQSIKFIVDQILVFHTLIYFVVIKLLYYVELIYVNYFSLIYVWDVWYSLLMTFTFVHTINWNNLKIELL